MLHTTAWCCWPSLTWKAIKGHFDGMIIIKKVLKYDYRNVNIQKLGAYQRCSQYAHIYLWLQRKVDRAHIPSCLNTGQNCLVNLNYLLGVIAAGFSAFIQWKVLNQFLQSWTQVSLPVCLTDESHWHWGILRELLSLPSSSRRLCILLQNLTLSAKPRPILGIEQATKLQIIIIYLLHQRPFRNVYGKYSSHDEDRRQSY